MATGYLLLDSETMGSEVCLMEMNAVGTTIEFKTTVGDITKCQFPNAYLAGRLIIYDDSDFGYSEAQINGV